MSSGGSWSDLVRVYLEALRRRGHSEGTIRAYLWGLDDFGRWLEQHEVVHLADLEAVDLEGWQDNLRLRKLAPRTQQLGANAVRNALRWGQRQGFPVGDLWERVESIKVPRLLPRPLTTATVNLVSSYLNPRRPAAPARYYRTRALWFYLITTGARVSEVLGLDRDDLARDGVVVRQKGGSEKVLWAPDVAMGTVTDYLRRRSDTHPALFVTHGDLPTRRLQAPGVREAWHELADQLNIPRWTTHQLRHTCATELLDANVPPEVVAAHLGHHGLASLAGYGEVRRGRREIAVQAMEERFARRLAPGQRYVVIKGGGGRRTELV